VDDKQIKELDAFLAEPSAALVNDEKAAGLIGANQPAMALFRDAAQAPNDGYLFAPKVDKPSAKTPLPQYGQHLKVYRLLLLDARQKLALGQAAPAQADLLAAVAFIAQLSGQKSGVLVSSLVEQLCVHKAYGPLAESLRGGRPDPKYLKELAAGLEKIANGRDAMGAALREEAATMKGTIRESFTPAAAEAALAKQPFWKRPVLRRLQDRAFFADVYARFDAAVDARAAAAIEAFRSNDAAVIEALAKKQAQELKARKEARDAQGAPGLIDGLRRGPQVKARMAEAAADELLGIISPDYAKLMPRYYIAFEELDVLRAAAAVKLYQAAKRRPPDSLAQLAPAFLPAVPQDPFNKFAPLCYTRKGKKFLVYGFGPDGVDGKGEAALDFQAYSVDPAANAGDILFAD
jgi:hypothetical protein